MQEILKVEKVFKSFGKKQIIKNISLSVNEGDILGFIGPNGAGKTTTIKCILGLQRLDSGTVIINGYNLCKDFKKAINRVGNIVEEPDTYLHMSGLENLELNARYYKNITKEEIKDIVKLIGLEKAIYNHVSTYSLGMRQRLGIGISLLNKPNLLILDEPMNGLDPQGIIEMENLFRKLSKNKIGILISSHNLKELESFCNKVCIIKEGQIIYDDTLKHLQELEDTYIVKLNTTKKIKKYLKKEDKVLSEFYVEVKKQEEELGLFIKKLIENDYLVYEIKKTQKSLEEAFIDKVGENCD